MQNTNYLSGLVMMVLLQSAQNTASCDVYQMPTVTQDDRKSELTLLIHAVDELNSHGWSESDRVIWHECNVLH